jgi:hypothetical protein
MISRSLADLGSRHGKVCKPVTTSFEITEFS